MEKTSPPSRSFSSYFFEKFDYIERSIKKDFWILLDVALLNINFTPKYRLLTIANIALTVLSNVIFVPSLVYTTYLVRSDLNHFINSMHYTLLAFFCLFLVIRINTIPHLVFEAHYRHAHRFYDYDEGDCSEDDSIREDAKKEKKALVIMPIFVFIIGCSLLAAKVIDEYLEVSSVIYFNGVNVRLIVPLYMPFDSHEGLGYLFTNMFMLVEICFIVRTLAACLLLFTIVMQRLIMQLRFLRSSIRRIEKRSEVVCEKLFGKTTSDSFETNFSLIYCLKKNIIHYQVIKRYFLVISQAVSDIMFLAFAAGTAVIALSMISISKGGSTIGSNITVNAMCAAEVVIMFLLCFYCERVFSECLRLIDEFYFISWFKYSSSFNRLMFTFKETIKYPLEFKAGGLIVARHDTFKAIMNTSYSFFNCLNAFEKKI